MKHACNQYRRNTHLGLPGLMILSITLTFLMIGLAVADVPDRTPPRGAVPNPGTQQQELANITAPAPYNVFEFVVTCGACHGGTIDQNAGHFGNWAGTSMASSARDPIFRANQLIVNNTVKGLIGEDGAGNMCFRCHSPNGWYSGRFDPNLAGAADGSTMQNSILLSTDAEGIMCELCHRSMGNVTTKRDDLDQADPVWKMMAGISDWPHAGEPYPEGPVKGLPYGDTSLQINDGMTYMGKYPGSVDIYFSDTPTSGTYTGQTYGVYPDLPGFLSPGEPVINADGSIPIHYEVPIGPPLVDGLPDYQAQAVSLEHPTVGKYGDPSFITTPEFCGSCHDLTVPVLNHGMPEQRTYTEWRFSDYGRDKESDTYTRCQDCHMPTMKHEYADDTQVSLNVDPVLAGWFPYGKDRNPEGGTAFHKFHGANRDLPEMMKELYPEVDLEVIGAPTGNDTRVFPGMLSHRDPMFDRAKRNTEISLNNAVSLAILNTTDRNGSSVPVAEISEGVYRVRVKVVNRTGHRMPSGYPDGRRLWLSLNVTDGEGGTVYESGYYDEAEARLYTDSSKTGFNRALERSINASNPVNNAVMVYEKVTGTCSDAGCVASPSLLNNEILFDNRIPPKGFTYTDYREAGARFVNYDPDTMAPYEDDDRFVEGRNTDVVLYTFAAAPDQTFNARAEALWQTHTREFMEHLKTSDDSTFRPQGGPSVFDPNYPLTPNYLSDQIDLKSLTDLDGNPLRDNWGGIAYAAWMRTGKGAPFLAAVSDSAATEKPATPDRPTGVTLDPFTIQVNWSPVTGAEGYILWLRLGKSNATSNWDRLAVLHGNDNTSFRHEALNVAKTYTYSVQAFNGNGSSTRSRALLIQTPTDLPLPPENLMQVLPVQADAITLSWFDTADNELGFVIERQDVPVIGDFYQVETIPTPNGGGNGGVSWTDTTVQPGSTYNYRVAAYNASGMSTYSLPVQATTAGPPSGIIILSATVVSGAQVDLTWEGATGDILGYEVRRSQTGPTGPWDTIFNVDDPNATGYSDRNVNAESTYWYQVVAYNNVGESDPSNVVVATTPVEPPSAPTDLTAEAVSPNQVDLEWIAAIDGAAATNFVIERALNDGAFAQIAIVGSGTTTYSDLTVEPKMTYTYQVAASNDGGLSGYSPPASVVTPGEPPEAPADLRVAGEFRNRIVLKWLDQSNNEEGFYLERYTVDPANPLADPVWEQIAVIDPNTTRYADKSLERKTMYCYRLQAFNADGVSAFTEICGTTK